MAEKNPDPITSLAGVVVLLMALRAGAEDAPLRTAEWLRDVPVPNPVESPSRERIQQAIGEGIAFLLERQNPNGSWGSATRTKDLNIYAPVPGRTMRFALPSPG